MIRIMPRWSIHPFAKTYVAGESVQETVSVVKKVNDRGFTCTLDILGEHVPVSYTHLTLPTKMIV